jgi:hypothetical protein
MIGKLYEHYNPKVSVGIVEPNHKNSGLRTSSVILNTRKQRFGTMSVFVFEVRDTTTSLGPQ